jgi:hypothetical protein
MLYLFMSIDIQTTWRCTGSICFKISWSTFVIKRRSCSVDRDRDVRAAVGGVYETRGRSLSSENLNEDSDSSIQNNTITLGDQLIPPT